MTTGRLPIGELDLLAYVDGQLEPQRRAEVEAYLARNPDEAAWVADCLEQNELIRELYDRAFHEPVPRALTATIGARPVRAASPLRRIAAALLLFLSGGAAGWWIGGAGAPPPGGTGGADGFMGEMVAAHVEARADIDGTVGIVRAADIGLPVLGGGTKAESAAASPEAPDLAAHGLALVGRRAVAGPDGRPALQLIYEDLGGRRLSLYLRPRWPKEGPEFDIRERGGLAVARWPGDPVIYGLASDLPADELAEIARTVDHAVHAVGGSAAAPVVADGNGAAGTVLAPVILPGGTPATVEGKGTGAADM